MSAADVSDLGAAFQFFNDTIERWQPFLHEMVLVGGAEEACGAAEQAFRAIVPTEALAAFERIGHLRLIEHHRRHQVADAAHEDRAVLVGEHHGLFGLHRERSRCRIVVDVSGRGLGRQPFAHATFVRTGDVREIGRGHRAFCGERLVETETVADLDQRRPAFGVLPAAVPQEPQRRAQHTRECREDRDGGLQRTHVMRGDAQQCVALGDGLVHQPELAVLEVADAAVDHVG